MPCGARGVFGGQVIGQALQASSQTVGNNLGLHSQHVSLYRGWNGEVRPADQVLDSVTSFCREFERAPAFWLSIDRVDILSVGRMLRYPSYTLSRN